MEFWPLILPGVWFGAKIGVALVEIMGRLEIVPRHTHCGTARDDTDTGEEEEDEDEQCCECLCLQAFRGIFWPTLNATHEPEEARLAWNLLFLALLAATVAFAAAMVEPDDVVRYIYLPFLGILGATIAMSTPVGGAIVFVPVLTTLNVEPAKAVAFGVATQMIGMGIFGFLGKVRQGFIVQTKTGKNPVWLNLQTTLWLLLGSWPGTAVALIAFPISSSGMRFMFTCFECLVFGYLQFGVGANLLGLDLWFVHGNVWKQLVKSGHTGATSWVVLRGEARVEFIFKVLLFFDIIRACVQAT